MFYIDLYLYLHWNNVHKLFKVKAAGSQIPQSDLRRERKRGRSEVVRGKYLQLDLLCVSVLCASISVSQFCARTQMSKSNQKCTKFMAFLWLRHKFIIILFEPGSSIATHTHTRNTHTHTAASTNASGSHFVYVCVSK